MCSPYFQGKLRRLAEFEGGGHHQRVEELWCRGVRHDPDADPDEAMHEYGVRLMAWKTCRVRMLSSLPWRIAGFWNWVREDFAKKLVKGGCFIDVKANSQRRP
jgi:hypothetical protein